MSKTNGKTAAPVRAEARAARGQGSGDAPHPERVARVLRTRNGMAMREVRRELAVWLMAVRVRVEELATAVDHLRAAVKDEENLLHDEVEVGRLTRAYTALATAAGDLDMAFPKEIDLPDVVATAGHWREFIHAPITGGKDGA